MSKRDGAESLPIKQKEGASAADVIGQLAFSVGLIDYLEPLSAQELRQSLTTSVFRQRLVEAGA